MKNVYNKGVKLFYLNFVLRNFGANPVKGKIMSKVSSSNGSSTSGSSKKTSTESQLYDYVINALASALPELNTLDTGTQASIQSKVDAYKNSGIQDINEMYNPMITGLENDIASRFGNLDNSIFMDDLSDIEAQRSDAVSSFAQDILAKQSELESSALNEKYSYVDLLSGLINDYYDNLNKISDMKANNTVKSTSGSSSSNNNINSSLNSLITNLVNNFI